MSNDPIQRVGTANVTAPVVPSNLIYHCLVDSEDSPDMNVDGSGTPVIFSFVVPGENYAYINSINIIMLDNAIGMSKFGGITGGLVNGLTANIVNAGAEVLVDFLDGTEIKQNIDFGLLAGVQLIISPGLDSIVATWNVSLTGRQIRLLPGEEFRVVVRDDLTSLDKLGIMVHGTFASEFE